MLCRSVIQLYVQQGEGEREGGGPVLLKCVGGREVNSFYCSFRVVLLGTTAHLSFRSKVCVCAR